MSRTTRHLKKITAIMLRIADGASKETLIRRSKYNNRKGRRAIVRLRRHFNTTVSWARTGYKK